MTQNMPRDERTLLRRIAELEERVRTLETAPRAAKTSFSNGQLTVGDPASDDRIEISAAEHHIRFNNADGPPTTLTAYGDGGAILDSAGDAGSLFSFATRALVWDGPYFTTLQVSRVDGDTSTVAAEVYADIQDSGGGDSRGSVSISARGEDHNGSIVYVAADGGLIFYTNSRTTDPPAPGLDSVVLYVKGGRLYYRDAGGTVHGPL